MPSEILGKTCFVSTRDANPIDGFQRLLNEKRADQIAQYLDSGQGTIPTAIILSAQSEADVKILGGGKTIQFKGHKKAFLILDGQHRVWGFSRAKTSVRVPVVIYNGLSRKEESRIFIDINTQQKPVPSELLLDIKSLADYESTEEAFLSEIFELFHEDSKSTLIGLTSKSKKTANKISRVTFNAGFKPIISTFGNNDPERVYEISNSYLSAISIGMNQKGVQDTLTKPIVFKAIISLFPEVARQVKSVYVDYSVDAFNEVLAGLFVKAKKSKFTKPGTSYKDLSNYFEDCLNSNFTL